MKLTPTLILLASLCGVASAAQDPTAASLDELLQQVREARAEEAKRNAEREQRFLAERGVQQRRLDEARAALVAEQARSAGLQQAFENNEARAGELGASLRERAGELLELFIVARQVAGDAKAVFEDSLVSSQFPGRREFGTRLSRAGAVPTIADLEDLWLALQQEMTESGKVVRYPAAVIGGDGTERSKLVTRVGPFNAVSDGAFLRYLPESSRLQELGRQPARRYRRIAADLERTKSGLAPMAIDPSRGAVLSLLVQAPDLLERVQQGRLVGYIIIGIAIFALLLVAERAFYLFLVDRRIEQQLKSDIPNRRNPFGRIMAVYQENRGADNETLELKLDEAILKETPRLHRGLDTLRILTVLAPLLGLLGTVTGLIDTFQSITLFGTGDPRLMAGGISEALVTTVLGLTTAIPLILLHSVLVSKSRRLVGFLEEQSAGILALHTERREAHVARA